MPEMKLGDVAQYINGRAFKPTEWEENGLPIIRIQNLTGSSKVVNRTTKIYDPKYLITNGDLLFAWSATLGAYFWENDEDGWLNQHIFKVIPNKDIDKTYLYYCLLYAIEELYSKTHGSGMVHITMKPFKETMINVPSYKIQKEIAAELDNYFNRLDDIDFTLKDAINESEKRKKQILSLLFDCKLNKNNKNLNVEYKKIKDVCLTLNYGTSKKSAKDGKVPVIRMGNLQDGKIDFSDLVYSNDKEDIGKYALHWGDVLFNRTNSAELVGKTSIFKEDFPAIYAGYLIKLNYDRNILEGDYLNYLLNSPQARDYYDSVKTDGVNQSNINAKKIGNFSIPILSLDQQSQSVKLVSEFLERENSIISVLESTRADIPILKKSLLNQKLRFTEDD